MEILLTEYENINPALTTIFPCTCDNYYGTFLAFTFLNYTLNKEPHIQINTTVYIQLISFQFPWFIFSS